MYIIYAYLCLPNCRQNSPKLAKIFHRELCDYKCSKESDYNKHLATRKHTKASNSLQNSPRLS